MHRADDGPSYTTGKHGSKMGFIGQEQPRGRTWGASQGCTRGMAGCWGKVSGEKEKGGMKTQE